MTDEKRRNRVARLKGDTNEELINRFVWYTSNYNPVDEDFCDTYELIKAEIFRRMGREKE